MRAPDNRTREQGVRRGMAHALGLSLPTPPFRMTPLTIPAHRLAAVDLAAWSSLEARALEPNAYQSPHFVMAALRHLGDMPRALLAGARPDSDMQAPLQAAVAVVPSPGTRSFPWPHLTVHRCVHTYLTTPLIGGDRADAALAALLSNLARRHPLAGGLLIDSIDAQGPVCRLIQDDLARRGLHLHKALPRSRAWLRPASASAVDLRQRLGRRFNDIERQRRRLAELGPVTWRVHRTLAGREQEPPVEAFLRLEHAGWKGDAGTSLRAQPAHEAFFRAMSRGFAAEHRLLFTELCLADRAIAASANFVSGGMGFAFKVGWDPAHRRHGPGILNEVELVRHAAATCPDLAGIDSGAEPDSFIDELWPCRRTLVTAFVPFNRLGEQAWLAAGRARRALQRARRQLTGREVAL